MMKCEKERDKIRQRKRERGIRCEKVTEWRTKGRE